VQLNPICRTPEQPRQRAAGLNRRDEAMMSFRRALSIDPRHADTLANNGAELHALKRYDERRENSASWSWCAGAQISSVGLLLSATALCDWQAIEDLEDRLKSEVINGKAIVPPFILLGAFDDPACTGGGRTLSFRCDGDPPRSTAPGPTSISVSVSAMSRMIFTLMPRHG